jgi:hypothetical protein
MDQFIALILAHFVSDWFFQPASWANAKHKDWRIRLLHSIQYAVIFLPVLLFLNISLYWMLYLLATHFIVDSYIPVKSWNKIRDLGSKKKSPVWLMIVQDQIIHILLLIPLIL